MRIIVDVIRPFRALLKSNANAFAARPAHQVSKVSKGHMHATSTELLSSQSRSVENSHGTRDDYDDGAASLKNLYPSVFGGNSSIFLLSVGYFMCVSINTNVSQILLMSIIPFSIVSILIRVRFHMNEPCHGLPTQHRKRQWQITYNFFN